MAATITSTNRNPIAVASGGTVIPFSYVHVDDPVIFGTGGMSGGGSGYLTITLHSTSGLLGTLSDPAQTFEQPTVSYDAATQTSTYRERTYGGPHSGGINALPDQILSRLLYTAPTLADGQTVIVYGTVSYTSDISGGRVRPTPSTPNLVTVTEPNAVTLEVGTPLAAVVPPAAVPPPTVPPVTVAPVLPPAPPPVHFGITNMTTGAQSVAAGNAYTGPVAGLAHELLLITPDNLAIVSAVPNVFIHSGSGTDAIDVSKAGGNNVLDGGGGSNFLVGGAGNDTFFLDARNAADAIWNTVENFRAGDAATIWGMTPDNFILNWGDNQGAAGHTGLTLAATAAGRPSANLTLAGYSTADLQNGRLGLSFGATADLPGAPGSQYLYIRAG